MFARAKECKSPSETESWSVCLYGVFCSIPTEYPKAMLHFQTAFPLSPNAIRPPCAGRKIMTPLGTAADKLQDQLSITLSTGAINS